MLVLDGIHRLQPDALAVLHTLVDDRELALFDGTRFLRPDRFAHLQQKLALDIDGMNARGLFSVPSTFRVVALATPPTTQTPWLTAETMGLFAVHPVSCLGEQEIRTLLQHTTTALAPALCDTLLRVNQELLAAGKVCLRSRGEGAGRT